VEERWPSKCKTLSSNPSNKKKGKKKKIPEGRKRERLMNGY
jgi:hypothetical protein